MGYVAPSGIIQLFKGIALDNRYMHTIYFANESQQDAWFTAKYNAGLATKKSFGFDKNSYSRPTVQRIKLKINVEEILGVTYMRFKNRAGMWFYAFINYVEYINENTTAVSYEIDVMQTWFISRATLNPCMVLREHVSNDTFGEHLESEPVGSDVYDLDNISCPDMDSHFNEDDYIVVETSADAHHPPTGGDYSAGDSITHGIYTPTWHYYNVLNDGGVNEIYDAIYNCLGSWALGESQAEIFSIIQFPGHFIHNPEETYAIKHPNNLNGYVPQNKKLYGFPYSYLLISTMDGTTAQYRWEYFQGDVTDEHDIQFRLLANERSTGCIALYPTYYNRITDNFDAKIVMDNFPKCSFAYDAYQAWIASGGKTKVEYEAGLAEQRGAYAKESIWGNMALDLTEQTFTLADQLNRAANAEDSAAAFSAGMGAAKTGTKMVQNVFNASIAAQQTELSLDEARHKKEFAFKDAKYAPNVVVGTQSPTLASGYKKLRYRFFNAHVRKEELVKIDDFLTVYGYSINKVDVPHIHNRPYWNFIQTRGCNVTGEIPASSLAAINNIFDGGIFFWANGDNIGNFEVGGRNGYGALINKN